MKKFDNILIIRTDRIGDVVLTTPAIKALRKAYPASRISILVTPQTKDLVQGNPYLDEVLVDERAGRHQGLLGFYSWPVLFAGGNLMLFLFFTPNAGIIWPVF